MVTAVDPDTGQISIFAQIGSSQLQNTGDKSFSGSSIPTLSELFPKSDSSIYVEEGVSLNELIEAGLDPCNFRNHEKGVIYAPEGEIIGFAGYVTDPETGIVSSGYLNADGQIVSLENKKPDVTSLDAEGQIPQGELISRFGDQTTVVGIVMEEFNAQMPNTSFSFSLEKSTSLYDTQGNEVGFMLSGERCLMFGGQCYGLSDDDWNELNTRYLESVNNYECNE